MPGASDQAQGNIKNSFVLSTGVISPTIVNANTTSQQTFAVPGLLTSDQVSAVSKPTYQTGLIVTGGACLTAGVLTIQFANCTAGNITPTASETYTVEINRPSNPQAIPTAIV
jgi:hypothetical protein